jgi:integrase/recombinase XerD
MVKGHFRAAGIDDERHTAGTMAYRQNRNVAATKQYMRHANINTTMIYIHDVERDENQMAEQVAAALLE